MTLLAVFSDLHGNTPALRAVLAAIDAAQPDVIVNLGDVASGGVDPRGSLDLLRERPDILTIAGNHERQLLTDPVEKLSRSDTLAHSTLTPENRAWLEALPAELEPVPGVLATHAAPGDDCLMLHHRVDEHGVREATDAEIVERLGEHGMAYDVVLCGHSHLQRCRQIPGGPLVVNPGSAGMPAFASKHPPFPMTIEAGTPHARFALLRRGEKGWSVEMQAIDYPWDEAAALARTNNRPDVEKALLTGRV